MSDLNTLKKIIPPDQAVANKALSRSLQQVKRIFVTDLPELAPTVAALETVDDLPIINSLQQPLPDSVIAFYANTFATGTGPGNTVTTDDVIGIAAGTTVSSELPVVVQGLTQLNDLGALTPLTANGGTPTSSTNGIYTVMSYVLAGAYTTSSEIDPGPPPVTQHTVTIPSPLPGAGSYSSTSLTTALSDAFDALIPLANSAIANINSTYSNVTTTINQSYHAVADRLAINVDNCVKASIDIANVAVDIANANLVSNSTSTVLNFTSSLHDFGLDVAPGGTAGFLARVADTSTMAGQAVIASMREGRNIERLNQIGILLDTQIPSAAPVGNVG
jgi:hypothetical protein